MSVFEVILAHIFPRSSWKSTDIIITPNTDIFCAAFIIDVLQVPNRISQQRRCSLKKLLLKKTCSVFLKKFFEKLWSLFNKVAGIGLQLVQENIFFRQHLLAATSVL